MATFPFTSVKFAVTTSPVLSATPLTSIGPADQVAGEGPSQFAVVATPPTSIFTVSLISVSEQVPDKV